MSWPRVDFHGFLANSCSIGDEKRGNMHRPGHFAADFLEVRQAARVSSDFGKNTWQPNKFKFTFRSQLCAAPIPQAGIPNFTPACVRWNIRKKS